MANFIQGYDRNSLIIGFILGSSFTVGLGVAFWYVSWTWGRLKRPFLAQQEVRDINKESWETFRSGGVVGCRRILFYGLVAAISAWFVINMLRMSAP